MTSSDLPDLEMSEIDGLPLGAVFLRGHVHSDGTEKFQLVELEEYFIEFDKPCVLPWTLDHCNTSSSGVKLPSPERVNENPQHRIGMILRDYSPKYGAGFEYWKCYLKNVPVQRQTGGPLNKRQAKTGLTWVGDKGKKDSIFRVLHGRTYDDDYEIEEERIYIAYLLPSGLSEEMCKKDAGSDLLEPYTDREVLKDTIPLDEGGEPTYGKEIDGISEMIAPPEIGYEPIWDRVYPEAYWEVFGDDDPQTADEFFETFAPVRDFGPWLLEYGEELTTHPEKLLDGQPDHWEIPLDRIEWTESDGVVYPDEYPPILELIEMGTIHAWKHELFIEHWEGEYEVVWYESGEVMIQHEDAGSNPNFEGDPIRRQRAPDAEIEEITPSEMERSEPASESGHQEHPSTTRPETPTNNEDAVTLDDLIN